MSTWIEVKKEADIELCSLPTVEDTIDVFIGDDDFGNNYVSIPVRLIIAVLEKGGYKIT